MIFSSVPSKIAFLGAHAWPIGQGSTSVYFVLDPRQHNVENYARVCIVAHTHCLRGIGRVKPLILTYRILSDKGISVRPHAWSSKSVAPSSYKMYM